MMEHEFTKWKALTPYEKNVLARRDGMSYDEIMDIASNWNYSRTILVVCDIRFKDSRPSFRRYIGFTDYSRRSEDEFVEFMSDISLTHRVMFVEGSGRLWLTESRDNQTNIDADLITAMLNAYK